MALDSHPISSMPSSSRTSMELVQTETHGASSQHSTISRVSTKDPQKHDSIFLSGSVFLITSDGRTLDLPIPSESPLDPLSWTKKKRALAFTCVGLFIYAGLVAVGGASAALAGLVAEFPPQKTKPFTIQTLATTPTLTMGIGSLIWVPMTFAVGRRPTFVIAALMLFLSCVGASFSRTFLQLLTCISFIGLAEGFSVTVAFLIIIDLTFIHSRPSAIAIAWAVNGFLGTLSLAIVPLSTNHGTDWRHFYTFWSLVTGVTFLFILLFFPETYFKRPAVAYDGRTFVQTASEKVAIYTSHDLDASDRTFLSKKDVPSAPTQSRSQNYLDHLCLRRASCTSWKSMLRSYPQIFFCLANPLVFWVAIMSAVNEVGFVYIVSNYATILSAPPYGPSTANHAVIMNIAGATGYLLAWPLGGILLRGLLNRLSRRNRGVREAEHYLVGYILPLVGGSLSTVVFGLASEHRWPAWTYYGAYGLSTLAVGAMNIANMLWVTEAFPQWAAPALVVVSGGSMALSYSLSLGLGPWVGDQGFLMVGVVLAALQVVTGLVFVPAAFWGKGLRQRIHGRWADGRQGALRPL